MFSRRRFIHRSFAVLLGVEARWRALTAATGPTSASSVRIGTIVDASRGDLARGIRFGFTEAARSAALFGWTVEHLELPLTARLADGDGVHAVVLGAAVERPPSPALALRLVCDPEHARDGALLLAPCATPPAALGAQPATGSRVWVDTLTRYGAEQLNARYRAAIGAPMSADAWLGWFGIKVIVESALRSGTADPATLKAYMLRARFDGHKGEPLYFDAGGRLRQPLYRTR